MKTKIYSYFLVFLQFVIIVLLLVLNDSILNNTYSFLIFIFGLFFGVYTLLFNRLSNFNISPLIKKDAVLITWGAYKYIRHPMYFSVFLMMFGVTLVEINLLNIFLYLLLMGVLYLKAKKEESLWSKELPKYKEYMKTTKMFIPFVL